MSYDQNKHAYCIIAHDEPQLLGVLISLLDDERNDVFLLLDKKTSVADFQPFKMSKGRLLILPQTLKITWGSISQVEAELAILEYAQSRGHYNYYHLLSGHDLPIKSQNDIHKFFNEHDGFEFMLFSQGKDNEADLEYKTRYYHLDFPQKGANRFTAKISQIFVRIQMLLGVHRRYSLPLYKGVNWASMTPQFVEYLISQRSFVLREFKGVLCADEIYKHSILMSSQFKDKVYVPENNAKANVREIDWREGKPYVWTCNDIERLRLSSNMFARKFSIEKDSKAVNAIEELLRK